MSFLFEIKGNKISDYLTKATYMIKQAVKIISVFLFVTLFGCNPSKLTFGNSDKWIPADFNPGKTILLVQKFAGSKKVQQQMEDYMAENYSNKYEIVDEAIIEQKAGKYANTNLYRFALRMTTGSEHITKAQGASTNAGISYSKFDFYFYDREAGKSYPTTRKESSNTMMLFKPVINTIVKKFE